MLPFTVTCPIKVKHSLTFIDKLTRKITFKPQEPIYEIYFIKRSPFC